MQVGDCVEFHCWRDEVIGDTFCRTGAIQKIETFRGETYLHICQEKTSVMFVVHIEKAHALQRQ